MSSPSREGLDVDDGSCEQPDEEPPFAPGVFIALTGMKKAQHLEGAEGKIEEWDESNNCWVVRLLSDNSVKKVRAERMTRLSLTTSNRVEAQFKKEKSSKKEKKDKKDSKREQSSRELPVKPGAEVRLEGMKNSPHLEGALGIIQEHEPDKDAWVICLHEDGALKLVKAEKIVVIGYSNQPTQYGSVISPKSQGLDDTVGTSSEPVGGWGASIYKKAEDGDSSSSESDSDSSSDSETDDEEDAVSQPVPVRTGREESLHEYLQAAAQDRAWVDSGQGRNAYEERARRLTISDNRFRMMHLLKYKRLRDSVVLQAASLMLFYLGVLSENTVWYKYTPTEWTEERGGPDVEEVECEEGRQGIRCRAGRAHAPMYPETPTWIGPSYIQDPWSGSDSANNGQAEALEHWARSLCYWPLPSVDSSSNQHNFVRWAEDNAMGSPVVARQLQDGTKREPTCRDTPQSRCPRLARCHDTNEVRCRRYQLHGDCEIPGHDEVDRMEAHNNAIGLCPWRCRECQQNTDEEMDAAERYQVKWCKYRRAVKDHMFHYREMMTTCMWVIFISILVLLFGAFNRALLSIVAITQLSVYFWLFFVIVVLNTGNPLASSAKREFLEGIQVGARNDGAAGFPIFDAIHSAMTFTLTYAVRPTGGFLQLWLAWSVGMFGAFSTLAWWGQVFNCNNRLSVPQFLKFFVGVVIYIIVLFPLKCLWVCFGKILGIPMCSSTWDPSSYPEPHKGIGPIEKNCCGTPVHPSCGQFVGDLKSLFGHFMRTLEWDGLLYEKQVCSDTEKELMEEAGIKCVGVQNYLAWRRSVLMVTLVFGICNAPVKPRGVWTSIGHLRNSSAILASPNTFDEFLLEQTMSTYANRNVSDDELLGPARRLRLDSDNPSIHPLVRRLLGSVNFTAARQRLDRFQKPVRLVNVSQPRGGDLARKLREAEETLSQMRAVLPDIADEERCAGWPNVTEDELGTCFAQEFRHEMRLSTLSAAERPVHGRRLPEEDTVEQQLSNSSSQDFVAFAAYLGAMGTKASTILQEGINEVGIYEAIIVAVGEVTVLTSVILAQSSWMYLPSSRDYVLFAWLLGIFSPFFVSLLPSTYFIQTRDLDEIIVRVIQETITFLSIDDAVEHCWTQLDSAVTQVSTVRTSAGAICGAASWAPERLIPTELTLACSAWDTMEETVDWDAAESHIRQWCTGLNSLLFQDDEVGDILAGGDAAESEAVINENMTAAELDFIKSREQASMLIRNFKERMIQFLHVAVSMQFAAGKMFSLLGAAIVMCPALIMSSFKVRLLLPLAKLPAVFLLVLPLIYCPLSWAPVSVIWQIIPEFWFLFFLIFQFFGMLVWTIEVMLFNFSEPMSRAHVNRILKKMGGMSMFVTFGALIFLAIWIATKLDLIVSTAGDFDVDLSQVVWGVVQDIMREPPITMILQLVIGIIFKLWLSKVASFDFIMYNMTMEYEYAEALKKMAEKMKKVRPEDCQDPEMKLKLERVNHIIQLDKEQQDALVALSELEAQSGLDSFQGDPGTLKHTAPVGMMRVSSE